MLDVFISDNEIRYQLLYETIFRNRRIWSLLSRRELSIMWNQQGRFRDLKGRQIKSNYLVLDPTYHRMPNLPQTEPDIYVRGSFSEVEKLTIQNMEQRFPYILELLNEFPQLIVCGGSIFKTMHNISERKSFDVDLFFVDANVEKIGEQEDYQANQSRLLMNIVKFLSNKWLSHEENKAFPKQHENWTTNTKVIIKRSMFVTTVYLHEYYNNEDCVSFTFQFMHRVYPNIGSILFGFDLGPCKIACDGKHLYATRLGGWSAFGKLLIVDTKTRSISFESRIRKYNEHCSTILIGLKNDAFANFFDLQPSREVVLYQIHQLLKQHNYTYNNTRRNSSGEDIYRYFDHTPVPQDYVRTYLDKKAKKLGYEVKKLKLDVHEEYTCEEIVRKAIKIAYSHGYHIEFGDEIRLYRDHAKFPFFTIKHYSDGFSKHHYYLSYLERLSDYETYVSSENIKFLTDYDTMYNNYYYIGDMNTSMLRCGNIEHISVLLTISKTDILYGKDEYYDTYQTGWPNIRESVINISNVKENQLDETYNIFFGLILNSKFTQKHLCIGHDENTYSGRVTKLMADLKRQSKPLDYLRKYGGKLFAENAQRLQNILKDLLSKRTNKSWEKEINIFSSQVAPLIPVMIDRVKKNAISATELLLRVKWIVKNPWRQWTSSINPIIKHPKDWYGNQYNSFRAYDENHETQLRLLYLRWPFNQLPKDIFKIILLKVVLEEYLL